MNDLDLAALACWERAVEIAWEGRQTRVVLRVIGDRSRALEAGFAAMGEELARWEPGTARHAALARLLATLSVEELAEEALMAELGRLERAAMRMHPDPPLRRDLEAGESAADFAGRRAAWLAQAGAREAERAQALARLVEERRCVLLALPVTELVARVLPGRVQQAAWEAFEQAAMEEVLAEAVRAGDDPERRLFASGRQVRALPAGVVEQLAAAYRELDPGVGSDLPKG